MSSCHGRRDIPKNGGSSQSTSVLVRLIGIELELFIIATQLVEHACALILLNYILPEYSVSGRPRQGAGHCHCRRIKTAE